ncbi:MAG: hypothetical protein ACO3N7_08310 [Kiritimatiellia bacterium]
MRDDKGHARVRERILALPGHLRDQLSCALPAPPPGLREHGLLATGVGSSEAAARYLVQLCNRAGIPAEFQPLSFFYGQISLPPENPPYLALFSQGLSPNAGIVLEQRQPFAGTLLFTASTPEGQRRAGKPGRAACLEMLTAEGSTLILHPLENEYEILPRFVGPLCAMFAVALFMEQAAPGSLGGPAMLNSVPDCVERVELPPLPEWVEDLQPGLSFWFTQTVSQYAQNLSCKLLETLFLPPPTLGDLLAFSHGAFQLSMLRPSPHWIFCTRDPVEQQLLNKLLPLYNRTGTYKIIESPLPAPLSVFYFEAYLNQLLLQALEGSGVNLIQWPGKGMDGEGYGLCSPGIPPGISPRI